MTLPRPATSAILTCLLPALAASAAWADINVSSGSTDLNSTLDAISTTPTSTARAANISILQGKVALLNAQINAASSQGRATQLQATSTALQGMITKLQQGYNITSYSTTTDASTQATTITIHFTNPDTGTEVTQTSYIPPVPDSRDNSNSNSNNNNNNSGSSGSSGGFDGADMLTQLLQQAGMQMGGNASPLSLGSANPLSAVQSTLNDVVSQAAKPAPATPADKCMSDTAAKKGVAVYDIAAGKVYMPDGTVLDAHSGMGNMMDNPDYVNQRMNGPTPPNTYNLSLRESPYYGVEALRLTPTDPGSMFGRDGILAHTKLVRGNNGSHGCVAFTDYAKFLSAFKNGQVKQLVVVKRKSGDKAKTDCAPPTVDTANPQSGAGGMAPNF